jgi:thymidylate synthase ThyX
LRVLASEVDDVFPRKLRLIDELIAANAREIARLQRRLATNSAFAGSVNGREPDLILFSEVESAPNAAPEIVRYEDRPMRRAA